MYLSANSLRDSFPSILSPVFTVCRILTTAIVIGGIWFPIVILISILAAIRDAEHLVLWRTFDFVFSGFFFFLKGVRTIYLWQLASWELAGFEIYFSSTCPTAFPEGICQFTELHTALVNWGVCVHWWSSCSYRKFPQDGSTFACPTLVPGAARSLGPVGFLGCEIEWNVPEQAGKGLRLNTFSPLKPHTSILSRLMPSGSRAHCWGCLGA